MKGGVRIKDGQIVSKRLKRELWAELRKYGQQTNGKPTLCRNASLFDAVWDPLSIDFADQDALMAEADDE